MDYPVKMTNLTPQEWHKRFTEQARWTASLRQYLFEQIHLPAGARLLEVGCGTGALLAEMNPAAPTDLSPDRSSDLSSGRSAEELRNDQVGYAQSALHGLDIDLPSLRLCAKNAPPAALTQGDAHCLPYASASFDAVFCHFLLLWVDDPVQVVSEMKRLTRPGGAVLALAEPDYGGRIDYPDQLAQLGLWQQAALRDQGADPSTGRKLAAIFQQAGLANIQTGVLGGQWRMDDPADESEWQVLQHDLSGKVSEKELADLRQLDLIARRNGQRILFVPTFYALGRVG